MALACTVVMETGSHLRAIFNYSLVQYAAGAPLARFDLHRRNGDSFTVSRSAAEGKERTLHYQHKSGSVGGNSWSDHKKVYFQSFTTYCPFFHFNCPASAKAKSEKVKSRLASRAL